MGLNLETRVSLENFRDRELDDDYRGGDGEEEDEKQVTPMYDGRPRLWLRHYRERGNERLKWNETRKWEKFRCSTPIDLNRKTRDGFLACLIIELKMMERDAPSPRLTFRGGMNNDKQGLLSQRIMILPSRSFHLWNQSVVPSMMIPWPQSNSLPIRCTKHGYRVIVLSCWIKNKHISIQGFGFESIIV